MALAVSTFSWMAAWLSNAAERIFMPVAGIFNPRQRPDIDLVPRRDARYVLQEFPKMAFSARSGQMAALLQ